ncbi:MAG: hypothetical protein QOF57_2026 [Frankiaceae bacterium]|nr:hypothetical protein [Frankiaceae bacterium]
MGTALLISLLILAALVGGYFAVNLALRKRVTDRHGSAQDAAADASDPVPSTHLVADDETPAGDTPEAHDEINPHDLPMDHPGRQAAEEQAGAVDGTTRGSVDAPSR